MENLIGKQFGPYQITAFIGQGGMAAVYKAYQANMDRDVALKILPRHLAKDPEFVQRFEREVKTLAKLRHPHILPIFDYGHAEGYSYLVMPFVQSGTLAQLLQKQALSLLQINHIIFQIGSALDYAHAQGFIHRDIKPSNILIDAQWNYLLADFGIAKLFEETSKLTTTGKIMGTPAYMSPEQGQGHKIDIRSDIYSLGIMLYEMVTGRVPFLAETPVAVILKHIQAPLPMPRTLNPTLPKAIEQVILKALAKRPADRFATTGSMVQALQMAMQHPAPSPKTKLIVSKWVGIVVTMVGVLVYMVAMGLPTLQRRMEDGQLTPVTIQGTMSRVIKPPPVTLTVPALPPPSTIPSPTASPTSTPLPTPTSSPTIIPASLTPTPTLSPTPSPTPEPTSNIFTLEDFDSLDELHANYWINAPGNELSLSLIDLSTAEKTNAALILHYKINNDPPSNYVGLERNDMPAMDWRNYFYICVWVQNVDNFTGDLVIQFRELSGEVWKHSLSLRNITVREVCLQLREEVFSLAQHSPSHNQLIDLAAINNFAFYLGQGGRAEGQLFLDSLRLEP